MKKIITSSIIFLALIFNTINISANESVIVSAVVWLGNQWPVIIDVNPDANPWIIGTNKTQNYTLTFKDNEEDTVTYTITPNSWFSNPISWTISSYDNNWLAYINFVYLSPAIRDPNETITVTINDWTTTISKTLNLYIY